MVVILIYTFASFKPLTYKEYTYPEAAIGMHFKYLIQNLPVLRIFFFSYSAAGWTIAAFGIMQLPIWAVVEIVKAEGNTILAKIRNAFKPMADWGPRDPIIYERYQKFRSNSENSQIVRNANIFQRFKRHIYG